MIDSIFVAMYFAGLILFILGIERKNITYTGANLVLFLILWVQSIYIEIPWIAVTSATEYTLGNQQHLDPAVGASCWLFIIIDVLIFFYYFLYKRPDGDAPAMP